MDTETPLYQMARMLTAFSVTVFPGCVIHLLSDIPLLEAISASTTWLVPCLAYFYFACRSRLAVMRLIVFLLPFGRLNSFGLMSFCWLWPIAIPMFIQFNRRLDSGDQV